MRNILPALIGALIMLGIGFFAYTSVYAPARSTSTPEEAYRCEEGTEFSIEPSQNQDWLLLIPATSVEHVKQTLLKHVGAAGSPRYEGEGIVFIRSADAQLTFGTTTTPCHLLKS